MTKATLAQAKSNLADLADAAMHGEQVVITRGSKPAVAIVPADATPAARRLRVSNAAASYLANEARFELTAGLAVVHESPAAFAAAITKPRRRV
jgi:prevent-host-death family protein